MDEFDKRFNVCRCQDCGQGKYVKSQDLMLWNTFHTWPGPQQSLSLSCKALNVSLYESSVGPSRPRVFTIIFCCCFSASIFQSRISNPRVPKSTKAFHIKMPASFPRISYKSMILMGLCTVASVYAHPIRETATTTENGALAARDPVRYSWKHKSQKQSLMFVSETDPRY